MLASIESANAQITSFCNPISLKRVDFLFMSSEYHKHKAISSKTVNAQTEVWAMRVVVETNRAIAESDIRFFFEMFLFSLSLKRTLQAEELKHKYFR